MSARLTRLWIHSRGTRTGRHVVRAGECVKLRAVTLAERKSFSQGFPLVVGMGRNTTYAAAVGRQ